MIHPLAGGGPVYQPYSHDANDAINSVSRGGLNIALLNAASAYKNIAFFFDHTCLDIDIDTPSATFATTGGTVTAKASLILGADGAFSPVRGRLQKTDRFEYSQTYLQHGYKELHIPATAGGEYAMEPHALHIWPRGGSMMIALPNRDKSFTCTLFWPFRGEHSFANLQTREQVMSFFSQQYSDAVPLMPTLADDYAKNPTSSLVTVRCWPWQYNGKVCVLGDSAHAIVPFYGQGMNAAFEDCLALATCLREHKTDRVAALEAFEAQRKPNADAIADMALANFIEMRDKVGQPAFLYRKKIEQTIHAAFPDKVTPQYNLVSFSTVPYATAQQRGRELDGVLDALVARVPASLLTSDAAAWKARVLEEASPLLARLVAGKTTERAIMDISPALTEKIGVWPGDSPLTREVLCEIKKGDSVTLSTLRSTVHLGSHADGPNHYAQDAQGVGEMPLTHYIGPCHVIAVNTRRGERVQRADLLTPLDAIKHPRVLLKTGTFPDAHAFSTDFAALSPTLIDALADRGVTTIGVDTPSVDLFDDKKLLAHNAIFQRGIAILEGLVLRDIAPGEYELIAPPLKLMGFDGSPVRAALRPLQG
jgi:kynurenine 3-monooxygenase